MSSVDIMLRLLARSFARLCFCHIWLQFQLKWCIIRVRAHDAKLYSLKMRQRHIYFHRSIDSMNASRVEFRLLIRANSITYCIHMALTKNNKHCVPFGRHNRSCSSFSLSLPHSPLLLTSIVSFCSHID